MVWIFTYTAYAGVGSCNTVDTVFGHATGRTTVRSSSVYVGVEGTDAGVDSYGLRRRRPAREHQPG